MDAELPVLAAVIGNPISHSLSPRIFAYLSRALGRDLTYSAIAVTPEQLRSLHRVSRELSLFRGWNVTIPHKEKIASLVDSRSAAAEAIGAVNVVEFLRHGGGKTRGHNTDWLGVVETLAEARLSLRGKAVVLYGAGGAARAVAFALGKEGADPIYLINRSRSRSQRLGRSFGKLFPKSTFLSLSDPRKISEQVACLIHSTPVGMAGVPGSFVFPQRFTSDALAFDLLYRPANPLFLREARARGLRTINGLDMLIWQAIATWEIWFGKLDPKQRERLKVKLKRELV